MRYATGACALVTAGAVLVWAPPASADSHGGSAFGIAATGPVNISPLPAVVSTLDRTARRSLVRPPANALVDAGVLNAVAAPNKARSSVADLNVVKTALTATAIAARCENGKGYTDLAGATLAGRKLASAPAANTTVPVAVDGLGTVSATLNRQVRRPDGRLAVTALVVKLPVGGQTIEVANATCRRAATKRAAPKAPGAKAKAVKVAAAPVPSPVRRDFAVTG